jgi:hypothetical protein
LKVVKGFSPDQMILAIILGTVVLALFGWRSFCLY